MGNSLDEKYKKKFIKYAEHFNDIIALDNSEVDGNEMFTTDIRTAFSSLPLIIFPLSYNVVYGSIEGGQISEVIKFFENIDEDFERFLGIKQCKNEKEAIVRVDELLKKENDGMHKYYVVCADMIRPIGLFYIYDYKKKHKTCNISIGVSKQYRGQNLCSRLTDIITNELIEKNVMNRVGIEVELTNNSSLAVCKNKLSSCGFMYEGIKRNSYGIGINSEVYSKIKDLDKCFIK